MLARMSEPSLEPVNVRFRPTSEHEEVSAIWACPPGATAALTLGHGAGSTLRHRLVQELSQALNAAGIATFRFNYPYSERGRGMDAEPVRLATVRAAVAAATPLAGALPLFAGGHSMSGRMFSLAVSRAPLPGVRGLILFAFPLHSGAPNAARAAHLARIELPLLFISGTRDRMAEPTLLTQVVNGLPRATLHWLDTGDHGFAVLKRRQSTEPALTEVTRVSVEWMRGQL
jgi:predicted alpha/beta-hydrolase family hydrolase